ncbi:acyltransferase [Rhizobium sp. CNPSo 3968]|uniref:acyltransferase family protein n=1 Tax=Rhizobium sp. CNPSo 3968 TaxID=3021408 RepID=UPI00254BE90F|nr:acyltransferase [Rhizobium sp. CNPSo 3968]MDK4724013.1 acyltransferase [Rhizobium sp. CNPSo 3968]
MGTYRLILAFAVLYSHAFGSIGGKNPGVVAVISFFIISGYVMTQLMRKSYPTLSDVPAFFVDRAARLFPQFLFYLAASVILIPLLGLKSDFFSNLDWPAVLLNFLMLPLGYYMFGLQHGQMIPAAWSLGLELTFYLSFPLFFQSNEKTKWAIVLMSMAVATAAFYGYLDTDVFGYRLLPGTFFIFSLGSFVARKKWRFPLIAGIIFFTAFAFTISHQQVNARSFNFEVSLGGIIGLTAITLLPKLGRNWLDDYFGQLSYGVFLNHFLLIFICDRYSLNPAYIVPIGSLALSVLTYHYIEKPVLHWRHSFRRQITAAA